MNNKPNNSISLVTTYVLLQKSGKDKEYILQRILEKLPKDRKAARCLLKKNIDYLKNLDLGSGDHPIPSQQKNQIIDDLWSLYFSLVSIKQDKDVFKRVILTSKQYQIITYSQRVQKMSDFLKELLKLTEDEREILFQMYEDERRDLKALGKVV